MVEKIPNGRFSIENPESPATGSHGLRTMLANGKCCRLLQLMLACKRADFHVHKLRWSSGQNTCIRRCSYWCGTAPKATLYADLKMTIRPIDGRYFELQYIGSESLIFGWLPGQILDVGFQPYLPYLRPGSYFSASPCCHSRPFTSMSPVSFLLSSERLMPACHTKLRQYGGRHSLSHLSRGPFKVLLPRLWN